MEEEFDEVRMAESRKLIEQCMHEALGLYIAKEPKHGDEWRDKDIWKNLEHLAHEVEEIRRSKNLGRKYHNALDCCSQAAILAVQIKMTLQENGEWSETHKMHSKAD